jgi:retinol dehydrogenase-12
VARPSKLHISPNRRVGLSSSRVVSSSPCQVKLNRADSIRQGNIGLGQETCLQLAKHSPAQIYLAARNESKARDAIDGIKEASPQANVEFLELDLGDFESIKKAAKTVDTKTKRLDILINNAGVMALPPALTKSG